ncbi:MAG: molybdopterin molybdotransferase MoeA [Oscillospiraceae bacterium]|nr:molybdopterin molybdotransferase MoeA [Oscillospiraceae bacterium]
MLTVLTPEEALGMIAERFGPCMAPELVSAEAACGRVLCRTVVSAEAVPSFDRSTVDGYALMASDTFGCSDALPAILRLQAEVLMGEVQGETLSPGCCMAIPTGGALPPGADACVMLEYAEDYGDGTVGVLKPAAPGENLILMGDDAKPGQTILSAGRRLTPQDVGALAALGISEVTVCKKPTVGVISTGDELVPAEQMPGPGQVRDVNTSMLSALLRAAGAEVCTYGIVRDEETLLREALDRALRECDVVLISGGSSVGQRDAACRVIEGRGELLFHGVAMKPGKPTMLGKAGDKAVFGLPGHPAAASFAAQLFVLPMLDRLMGRSEERHPTSAVLTDPVSANHGRAQYMGVTLNRRGDTLYASPVRSKSGLITALAGTDGWFCIPRDREGVPAGEIIEVYPFEQ